MVLIKQIRMITDHYSSGDGWTTQTSIVFLEFRCKLQFNAASDLTAVDSLFRLSELPQWWSVQQPLQALVPCFQMCFGDLKPRVSRVYAWILLYLALSRDSRLQCFFHGPRANRIQPVPFPSSCCTVSTAAYFKSKQEFERNNPPSPHTLTLPCF